MRDGDDAFFEGLIVQRSDPPLKSRRPLRVVLQTPQKETVDIVLFRYHEWTAKKIQLGKKVRVYGKIQNNAGMWQMSHPEIDEIFSLNSTFNPILEPIYSEFSEVPKNALRHLIQQLFIYYDAIKIERHDCAIKNHLKTLHGLCIPEFYPVHESLYNQAFKALAFWEAVAYFRQLTAQTSAIEQTRAFNIQSGEHTAALLARL
ncbi:MAG: hypothetical protein FJ161_04375, partial [Gammaproteobacteria bacterium]|nr:hypothetical protein [Gammaproteobacteria bacterium]